MGLKDIGESLPPGFRFYPSDEELVCHYLQKKIDHHNAQELLLKGTLVEINLHACDPWQLPETAKLNENEWYFFSFRDRKYATGYRNNRATTTGYWKATGKDRVVLEPMTQAIVGMRKTLVFYRNRAPNGIKTDWIMHEFRLENPNMPPKEDWVLCRVFHKGKLGNTPITNNGSPPYMSDQINVCGTYIFSQTLPSSSHPKTTDGYENYQPTMPISSCSYQQHPNSLISPRTTSSTHEIIQQNQSSALNLASGSNPSFSILQCVKDQTNSNSLINFKSSSDNEEYGFMWDAIWY